MASLRKINSTQRVLKETPVAAGTVRVAADDHDPVASPAHDLQRVLHEAGYQAEAFRPRSMSNAMLVLSVVCVYALSMLMMFGGLTA